MLPTGGESGWLLYKKQKVHEQWPDFFSLRCELPLGHPWASGGLGIRIWQQNEEGLKLDMTSDSRKFGGGGAQASVHLSTHSAHHVIFISTCNSKTPGFGLVEARMGSNPASW